ncbi:hypothetical protein CSB68_0797 [Acinetobacter baumannii]|nr:hypothetical protein CSB70_2451 [Acinetobacter baumannii]AVI35590.1 hypothetical protein CSB68_0797 [Acinetobacter baumannii]
MDVSKTASESGGAANLIHPTRHKHAEAAKAGGCSGEN